MRSVIWVSVACGLVMSASGAFAASDRCLANGRKLEDKGLHKEASAALEKCLQATPGDATIESELSWSALGAHDLALAEKSARAAIDHAIDPELVKVKAAAFYNLGRVLEERKDAAAAIAAYVNSLNARQTAQTRDHLRALDKATAARLDPLLPKPLAGPYPSLQAYCKERIAADEAENDIAKHRAEFLAENAGQPDAVKRAAELWGCKCPHQAEPVKKFDAQPGVAWREAWMFQHYCAVGNAIRELDTEIGGVLAVKTDRGFFITLASPQSTEKRNGTYLVEQDVGLRPGRSELFWTFRMEHDEHNFSASDTQLVIIGLGPSGVPSATPPFSIKSSGVTRRDDGETKSEGNFALRMSWNKSGLLILTGTGEDGIPGTHELLFP